MTRASLQHVDLLERFIHLVVEGRAFSFLPDGSFWEGIDPTENGWSLGAVAFGTSDDLHHEFDERHDGIDELIVLGSGELEVWLDFPSGERTATIKAGQAVIVPANTWHRLVAKQPGWLIFCNRRKGISSRPHIPKEMT